MPYDLLRLLGKTLLESSAKRFGSQGHKIIGSKMISDLKPNISFRFDGRSPEAIYALNGLPARLKTEECSRITEASLKNYLEFNEEPIGLGTCESIYDLENGYGEGYNTEAKEHTLYGFYARSISANYAMFAFCNETNPRDYEKEHIVLDSVPSTSILFATTKTYRDELHAGLQVPNEMALYNPELPPYFYKKDIENLASILHWLISNDSESVAKNLVIFMCSHTMQHKQLLSGLSEHKGLKSKVEAYLSDESLKQPSP